MSIEFLTKKGRPIKATDDSRRYFQGTGNQLFGNTNSLPLECPYFIIDSPEYKYPLRLSFGNEAGNITIAPGLFSVYGHCIEISEETSVIDDISKVYLDFYSKCYVYVFIRVDLDDVGDERAKPIYSFVKTKGDIDAPYPEQENEDDLHNAGTGIYDVPVASFLYDPQAADTASMFTKVTYYIKTIAPAEKELSSHVDMVGSSKADDIISQFLGTDPKLYPNNAVESETCLAFGDDESSTPINDIKFWICRSKSLLLSSVQNILTAEIGKENKVDMGAGILVPRGIYRIIVNGGNIKYNGCPYDCSDGMQRRKGFCLEHGFTFTSTPDEYYGGVTIGLIASGELTVNGYSHPQLYTRTVQYLGWAKKHGDAYPDAYAEVQQKTGRPVNDPEKLIDLGSSGTTKTLLFPIFEMRLTFSRLFFKRLGLKVKDYYGSAPTEMILDPDLYGKGKMINDPTQTDGTGDNATPTASSIAMFYLNHFYPVPQAEEP